MLAALSFSSRRVASATSSALTTVTVMVSCGTHSVPDPKLEGATFHPPMTSSGDTSLPAVRAHMLPDVPPTFFLPAPTTPIIHFPFWTDHSANSSSPTFVYTARPLRISPVFL